MGSLQGQVVDNGYIWVTGTSPSTSWTTWGYEKRFVWNPVKAQLTAGINGLSSNSAGYYSFALGDYARPWGDGSAAIGDNVVVFGDYSFGLGENVLVNSLGKANVAIGYDITTKRDGAVAMGYSNDADGVGSIAIGNDNVVEGWGSLALGVSNLVDLSGPTVRGAYAIGHGLTVKDQDAFVVGKFNSRASDVSDDYAFVVGIGTDGANRADAFSVDASGNVWAAGSYSGNGSGLTGLAGGQIQTSGSNVGIGKSPSEKLDVNGDTWVRGTGSTIGGSTIANASLRVGDNLGMDNNEIYFDNIDGIIGTIGAKQLRFHTNGSQRMVIGSNGYVGIGTNSPTHKLHVDGIVRVNDYIRIDNDSETALVMQDSGGDLSIYHTVNDGQGNYNIMLGVNGDGQNPVAGDGSAKILFSGHDQDGELSLNVGQQNGTAGSTVNFNLGLSLDSTDQKLRIGDPPDNLGLDGGAGNVIADVNGNLFAKDSITGSADTNSGVYFNGGDSLSVKVGGTEMLTVDTDGVRLTAAQGDIPMGVFQ